MYAEYMSAAARLMPYVSCPVKLQTVLYVSSCCVNGVCCLVYVIINNSQVSRELTKIPYILRWPYQEWNSSIQAASSALCTDLSISALCIMGFSRGAFNNVSARHSTKCTHPERERSPARQRVLATQADSCVTLYIQYGDRTNNFWLV